jgi:hypothetical protein
MSPMHAARLYAGAPALLTSQPRAFSASPCLACNPCAMLCCAMLCCLACCSQAPGARQLTLFYAQDLLFTKLNVSSVC